MVSSLILIVQISKEPQWLVQGHIARSKLLCIGLRALFFFAIHLSSLSFKDFLASHATIFLGPLFHWRIYPSLLSHLRNYIQKHKGKWFKWLSYQGFTFLSQTLRSLPPSKSRIQDRFSSASLTGLRIPPACSGHKINSVLSEWIDEKLILKSWPSLQGDVPCLGQWGQA